ncbi:Nicotinate-nucleotide--dimethylbenzimidazole phosphoribosyltransferase [hydrothermal vent metagenome]|uniref:Nicotinate-nucleotide--dimethylbenzimidazole phosphoribosyltransferase n=1 Tax=hydrothermal vent metagenome TaxID=652676 RepID=A0A3B0UVV5_9ZZZZ
MVLSLVLDNVIGNIEELDPALMSKAQRRLDSLTKPRGSLGRLEEFAARIVGITRSTRPELKDKKIFVFASDHGVSAEGVSAFPKEVTTQMVLNFLSGGAGINALARHAGAEVLVVDIGVDFDFDEASAKGLVNRKIMRGSANIRKGPAMTRDETLQCINVGIELAMEHASVGSVFGAGEMGIANTTAASAIIAVLSGRPAAEVAGRGTGINDTVFARKVRVIEDALRVNSPDPEDPLDILSKVGGPEIAGICGLVLGAASKRVPVLIDGFISTAGALIATELAPNVRQYLFAAHLSQEKGHKAMLDRMGLRPFVDLDFRLGEGTGAAIGMTLLDAAVRIFNEMATFEEAGVSEGS